MRRSSTFVLAAAVAFLAALPSHAQRGGFAGGGSHGGFGAPSFSAPHSPAPSRFSASSQNFPYGQNAGGLRSRGLNEWSRGDGRGSGNRHPYPGNPVRIITPPYFYGYGGYLMPNFVGYPFGFDPGYDEQQDNAQAPAQEAYPQGQIPSDYAESAPAQNSQTEVAENEQQGTPYRPPYQGQGADQPVRQQPSTTIVFKDGRPNEQVQNYVLTRTTLYDLDGDIRQEIPLSEIDVPATVQTNLSAGVDFSLPSR
jgi:hypothetical protein